MSGIFTYGKTGGLAGATLAGFETTTAQEVMNRVGQFDNIDVKGTPGTTSTELVRNIRAALRDAGVSKGLEVRTAKAVADETANNIKQGLSFFNTFLLVFAFISLFVGAFIIYNTFSIIVAQRSRELALLRAIGASAKQVKRSVSLEAFVVGLLSSVLGLLLGIFVAIGLQGLLSAFGFALPSRAPVILPRTIIVALVVGTLVTYVSAVAPARRAAKVAPVAAMRDTPVVLGGGSGRYRVGSILLVIGVALLGLGLFGPSMSGKFLGGSAGLVGLAAAMVFIGVAMLSPLVARPVSQFLGWAPARFRGMAGVLARENAIRNPRRTATTASALMIGLALITLVAIIGASAKKSFTSIIDNSVRADYIVSPDSLFGQGFTPDVATQIRDQLPSSAVVEFRDGVFKTSDGGEERLNGLPADIEKVLRLDLRPTADLDAFADGGVLLYKNVAKHFKLKVGDELPMTFERTGEQRVVVQGIFDAKNRTTNTDYLLSLADYEKNYTDQVDSAVAVKVGHGESTEQARRAINGVLKSFPNVKVEDQAEFKRSQIAQFDTILNLLYVMLLLAVIIALIGIVNTLALSIYERTREIGLLRAVGMTRKQVKRMVRDEAVIIAIFGSFLGLAIGLLFGAALVSAIGSDVKFTIPFTQLAIFVILAGFAGLLAGMWPARRAAHHDVLDAIQA
ncbi:MAG: ABC transporter permease [Acidimicrobiia bacterium]